MFETASGVTVPHPERLREEYELAGDTLTMNLSFEKLPAFVQAFYELLPEPLFLAVHPDADNENLVYYLDGMTKSQLETVLGGYGELLYQDGLSSFAIASHETEEELFVQKYKVLSLYSTKLPRFFPLLQQFGVTPTAKLVTAWDTFSEAEPGSASRLQVAGETVEDMIKELQKIGMYQAK